MWVHCPKCNFHQPKDKYCASCGLDMDNYIPPKANPVQKVAKNFGVQIFIVIAILIIAGSILISRSETIRSTIGMSPISTISKSKRSALADQPQQALQSSPEEVVASTSTGGSAPTPAAAANAASDTGTSAQDDSNSTADSEKNITVKMGVYEINQDELQQTYETSRKSQLFMQFTDISAGMAPAKLKQWSDSKKSKTLYTESRSIDPNNPIEIRFLTQTDPPVGVMIALNLREFRNNTYYGDLEVLRLWKAGSEAHPQDDKVNFPADIEMAKGMSFFIGGLIPKQNLKILEEALKSIDIFKGITTPSFKNGQNDIVFAFEFDHTAPQK